MTTNYCESYPEHDRTSCDDEDLFNIDPDGSGCRRCNALLFDRYFALKKEVQELRKDVRRQRNALERTQQLFKEALSKFNWGASFLDSNAITLLNDVQIEVAEALKSTGSDAMDEIEGGRTMTNKSILGTTEEERRTAVKAALAGLQKDLTPPGSILSDEAVACICQQFDPVQDMDLARAIEQAVLNSPDVQAWKRDSELLDAVASERVRIAQGFGGWVAVTFKDRRIDETARSTCLRNAVDLVLKRIEK